MINDQVYGINLLMSFGFAEGERLSFVKEDHGALDLWAAT